MRTSNEHVSDWLTHPSQSMLKRLARKPCPEFFLGIDGQPPANYGASPEESPDTTGEHADRKIGRGSPTLPATDSVAESKPPLFRQG
jgi:hypothetical protein